MKCRFCGKKKKHGARDICTSCFQQNIEGCKTEYNRRYNNHTAMVECRFKCGRKTKNHDTSICITCARSTRRENNICFTDNFEQMRKQHEARWKRLGIIYTDEQLKRHITIADCDFCGASLKVYRAMDHDHDTNKYRGTLCRKCNVGLGQLNDNLTTVIERSIAYKERCCA